MTRIALLPVLVALMSAQPVAPPPNTAAATGEWRTFAGAWSATGRRYTLPAEDRRVASLVQLSGAVTVTSGEGLSRGLHGEVIGFDDGRGLSVGRAVWTGAGGDQLFSVIEGEAFGTGRRISGRITGGTGRFAGAAGDYALTWQYVVHADDDVVQGRAADLRGRIRLGEPRP